MSATLHHGTRGRIARIARKATAHNSGMWIEERQFAEHVRLEFPSWPRAVEAKGALMAAGFTVREPGGPVLQVYPAGVVAPPGPDEIPGYLKEVIIAAVGIERFRGRSLDDDEILELLAERELERSGEHLADIRDAIDRYRDPLPPPGCVCDGARHETRRHPFLVHPDCLVHAQDG
ncbi:hypothetical protein [Agromyces bauzanensis]